MASLPPVRAPVDADTSGFVSNMTNAVGSLGSLKGAALATGGVLAGAFAAKGLASATAAAAEFETEMTRLNTLVGIQRSQVQAWRDDILDLAPAVGKTPQELSRAMFAITSGGERGRQALDLLEQSAKASAIGLGDTTDIARTATAALQAFGDQGLTAEKAVDVMVATVREGNLEASDLAGAMGKATAIAATMGVSFEEVSAQIAGFTRLGVDARVAATGVRAVLASILRPSEQSRKAFDDLGISIDEMRRMIQEDGLSAALIELLEAADGNLDTIGNLIPNVRALAAALANADAQASELPGIVEEINTSLDTTDESFRTVEETAAQAFAELDATVESAKIQLGSEFLPVVTDVTNALVDLLTTDDIEHFQERFERAMGRTAEAVLDADAAGDRLASTIRNFTGSLEGPQEERFLAFVDRQIMLLERGAQTSDQVVDNIRAWAQALGTQARAQQESNETTEEGGDRQSEMSEGVAQIVERLRREKIELREGERALLRHKLETEGATDAQIEMALALFDQNEAIEERNERLKRGREELARDKEAAREWAEEARRSMAEAQAAFGQATARLRTERFAADLEEFRDETKQLSASVSGAAVDIVTSSETIGDAFRQMVDDILRQLARLAIQQGIIRPLLTRLTLSFLGSQVPALPGVGDLPTPTAPNVGGGAAGTQTAGLTAGGGMVVSQQINFNVSAMDGADARRVLQQNAPAIVEVVGQAARDSMQFQRTLRGG